MLEARSAHESRLYIELHPHECGERAFPARSHVSRTEFGLVATYEGACPRCGKPRGLEFLLDPELDPPPPAFAGAKPSKIIDPGEFLSVADDAAKQAPDSIAGLPGDRAQHAKSRLEVAAAAIDEVLKFIPPGQNEVPAAAFVSKLGNETYARERGRFERTRLEAFRDVYRNGLSGYDRELAVNAGGDRHGRDGFVPCTDCDGGGACMVCAGKGNVGGKQCNLCFGGKVCRLCGGAGEIRAEQDLAPHANTSSAHYQRGTQLAKDLLEGMDAPEDPARVAQHAEHDRRNAASLEAYYARTRQRAATAGTTAFGRVLAAPGSLAARKELLAEWKAQGDPRAELVESQLTHLELMHAEDWSGAEALLRSIRVAIAKHGRAWAGEIATLVDECKFHRGLVAEIKVSGSSFPALAPRLFGLAPIQHLTIAEPLGPVEALLGSPYLAKLISLNMPALGRAFGDHGAVTLARSSHASGLRWISLVANEIGGVGVKALAASPYLANVQYLGLRDNPADPTPYVHDFEGIFDARRPPLAGELEHQFGARPWLSVPGDPEHWPPNRESLALTP